MSVGNHLINRKISILKTEFCTRVPSTSLVPGTGTLLMGIYLFTVSSSWSLFLLLHDVHVP